MATRRRRSGGEFVEVEDTETQSETEPQGFQPVTSHIDKAHLAETGEVVVVTDQKRGARPRVGQPLANVSVRLGSDIGPGARQEPADAEDTSPSTEEVRGEELDEQEEDAEEAPSSEPEHGKLGADYALPPPGHR